MCAAREQLRVRPYKEECVVAYAGLREFWFLLGYAMHMVFHGVNWFLWSQRCTVSILVTAWFEHHFV